MTAFSIRANVFCVLQINTSPGNDVYSELIRKINSAVKDNRFGVGTLQYYDEERELITVSSDQELRLAISANKDKFNNLKIFVQMTSHVSEQRSATNSTCGNDGERDRSHESMMDWRCQCCRCERYRPCDSGPSASFHPAHETIRLANQDSFSPSTSSVRYHSRRHDSPHCCRAPQRPSSLVLDNYHRERNETSQWLVNRCCHVPAYASSVDVLLAQSTSPATNASTPIACSVATPTDSDTDEQLVSMIASTSSSSSAITSVEESRDGSDLEERAFATCLQNMQRMGFQDVNGALAALIRSNQGDINTVLDAIHRANHRQ